MVASFQIKRLGNRRKYYEILALGYDYSSKSSKGKHLLGIAICNSNS